MNQSKEMTGFQKQFVQQFVLLDKETNKIVFADNDKEIKHERAFIGEFNKRTEALKIPKEMFHKDMRKWLTQTLIKIPYANVFNNPQGSSEQELETYNELVTLNPEDMEWGVMQKAIALLLGISPDLFPIDENIRKVKCCVHDEKGKEMLSFGSCPTCHGEGVLSPAPIPTEEQLKLLSYNQIVQNAKNIQHFILSSVSEISEEVTNHIWFEKMTDGDRFNAGGIIAKIFGKQKQPQVIKQA